MAFTKAGINLSGLNNISQLNITTSFTPSDIIDTSITTLNADGGIWAVGIILATIYVMMFWALSETSPFGKFKYSYMRASLLAICVVNLLSITMISIGLVWSFRIVAIFIILNIVNTILVLSLDN